MTDRYFSVNVRPQAACCALRFFGHIARNKPNKSDNLVPTYWATTDGDRKKSSENTKGPH